MAPNCSDDATPDAIYDSSKIHLIFMIMITLKERDRPVNLGQADVAYRMSILEAVAVSSDERVRAGLHRLHRGQAAQAVAAVIEIRTRPWFISQATPVGNLARQEDPHLQCVRVEQLVAVGAVICAVPRGKLCKAPIRVLSALKILLHLYQVVL